MPYYVVRKDLARNIVYVSKNLNAEDLWATELRLEDLHLRNGLTTEDLVKIPNLQVRLRHRAPLINVNAEVVSSLKGPRVATRSEKEDVVLAGGLVIKFGGAVKRPAAGQSAVLYSGEVCLGGGIVAE